MVFMHLNILLRLTRGSNSFQVPIYKTIEAEDFPLGDKLINA